MQDVEEFVFSGVDLDGQVFDWINLVEPEDYIEFVEKTGGDTSLYECIEEPKIYSTERSIRVKFIKDTGPGDGNFNLQEEYDVRVIKSSTGIDIVEADKRYLQKPYVTYFEDTPANITPVHEDGLRNGELWFDTTSLELFVWNNNSWVGASPPPTQDITVTALEAEIAILKAKPDITASTTAPTNAKQGDLWFNPSTLKFAFFTSGAWVNPDQS